MPEPLDGGPTFGCEVIHERDRVRLAPFGELDLATGPQLEDAVRELWASGSRRVIVDLRGLSFIDVSGSRVILGLDAAAHAESLTFELVAGGRTVQRLLGLTGALERLRFRSSAGRRIERAHGLRRPGAQTVVRRRP